MAVPITNPPTNNQNPLAAKPENMASGGAAPIARKARKIMRAVVASGRLRVANNVIPATDIARTCKDASDVKATIIAATRQTRAAKVCAVLSFVKGVSKRRHLARALNPKRGSFFVV